MAVTTLKGHVSRALDFYNKPDIYFGIGKTTPWTEADRTPSTPSKDISGGYIIDDYKPPVPEVTGELTEVAGYKKAETIFLVVPDPEGTLTYRNTKWKIVPKEEALDKGARWVFLSTFVAYTELPTEISYRQIGAFTGLKAVKGTPPGKYHLLPEEVEDEGIIEILDNRTPIFREPDQREQLVLIIEF